MTEYTLNIPAPAEIISANFNKHWGTKARIVKAWRGAVCTYATQARLPKNLPAVEIHLSLWFPTKKDRDRENYSATLKPIIDGLKTPERPGLAGYGLIADDTPRFLVASSVTLREEKHPAASHFGFAIVRVVVSEVIEP